MVNQILIASAAAWKRCTAAGRDVFIGGRCSSVFLRGGDGDDILVGGLANDALAGENGDDYNGGAAGDEVMHNVLGSISFLTNKTIFCATRFSTYYRHLS